VSRHDRGPNGEKVGTRVKLVSLQDHYSSLKEGEMGTVKFIDAVGTIHCEWDNGSTLGLVDGVDRWEVLGGH
jgi:hypothetical protein